MIELKKDGLEFSFPEVHPDAKLRIEFQRTLRIPDDESDYPLPPGLGEFPLRHVDDRAENVPDKWLERGGVMMPMYQSEAMWINFKSHFSEAHTASYPFAVKVATGKINAVTGDPWENGLREDPQDYAVIPEQPWLDGYCVEKGIIRQFVAMPLGAGYTAEEQLSGEAEHGGIQIVAFPMRREIFEKRFPKTPRRKRMRAEADLCYCVAAPAMEEMGLAPGGRMRQEIYDDPFDFGDWDRDRKSRCFVHITNSLVWRAITGSSPPTVPPTAREYTRAGLPWFEYYGGDTEVLGGAERFKGLKSVFTLGKEKGDVPLPENDPVTPGNVKVLRADIREDQVREGDF